MLWIWAGHTARGGPLLLPRQRWKWKQVTRNCVSLFTWKMRSAWSSEWTFILNKGEKHLRKHVLRPLSPDILSIPAILAWSCSWVEGSRGLACCSLLQYLSSLVVPGTLECTSDRARSTVVMLCSLSCSTAVLIPPCLFTAQTSANAAAVRHTRACCRSVAIHVPGTPLQPCRCSVASPCWPLLPATTGACCCHPSGPAAAGRFSPCLLPCGNALKPLPMARWPWFFIPGSLATGKTRKKTIRRQTA